MDNVICHSGYPFVCVLLQYSYAGVGVAITPRYCTDERMEILSAPTAHGGFSYGSCCV